MEIKEIKQLTKYPKINTIFERDKQFKVTDTLNPKLDGILNVRQFQLLEKIDGTNVGLIITPGKRVFLRKRSDIIAQRMSDGTWTYFTDPTILDEKRRKESANVKQHIIYTECVKDVDFDKILEWFSDSKSLIVIFGEGCGSKIQKRGQNYSLSPTFRVFDVKVGNSFFDWRTVEEFCKETGLKTVPVLDRITLEKKDFTVEGMKKLLLKYPRTQMKEGKGGDCEGIVVRTELLNRFGQRLMFKIKFEDY